MSDIEIRYANPRLQQIEDDYHTWAGARLDQMDAEGLTRDQMTDRLAAETPDSFLPVMYYNRAYVMATEICAGLAREGRLIALDDGTFVDAGGAHLDAVAHIAEEAIRRIWGIQ